MRVLHVLPTRAAGYGGPVVVAEAMVEQLSLQGIDARLYPSLPGETDAQEKYSLSREVVNSDLVHIHGLWSRQATLAARAASASRTPYIVTPHGMLDRWALNRSRIKKSIYGYLFERRNLSRAARLHFLNSEEQDEASTYGIQSPSFVLPNGVVVEKYADLPSRETFCQGYPHLKDKVLALFLGRLHPKKGFDLLLPALAQAVKSQPLLHLLIAGPDEGGYLSVLEKLVTQYNLQNHVTFLGSVTGKPKLEALGSADFFVLSSHQEGDSVAVKEAMASSLPVIITPACHFSDVNTCSAGFVVQPTVVDVAQALIELTGNKGLCCKMGENAAELMRGYYSWSTIAERLRCIYKDVLSEASGGMHA